MEQRIGSSSQPLDGAGIDPAFIPGLTSSVSVDQKESAQPDDPFGREEAMEREDSEERAHSVGPQAAVSGKEEAADEPEQASVTEEVSADQEEAGEKPEQEPEEPAVDGPVFEAADRRARIVADHSGVRLRLDDQECEFRWDEIGAVETETARFGKRFTVTVHTPERRWYPIEIEADSRSRFEAWETRLDEVLDAYFEDGEAEPAAPEKADD